MSRINTIEITNLTSPELDVYARLNENQLKRYYEPEEGIFIAESPKVIERAIDAGYEPLSFLVEKKQIEPGMEFAETAELLEKAMMRYPDTRVYAAEFDLLTQLTGFKLTRGMLAAMRRKTLMSVAEACSGDLVAYTDTDVGMKVCSESDSGGMAETMRKRKRRIAVLDEVENPTNVGAIFRSAAALNIDAILLTQGSSDPLYRRAARVSMGTVFQIPWTFTDGNSEKLLRELHSMGYKAVAMALTGDAVSIDDTRLKNEEKLAIFLGTEGDGLAEKTIQGCDYTVKIPMSHGVDSLNVAAASAVAFWELGQQW